MVTNIQPRRGAEFPRRYTKSVSDFGDWKQLEPLFAELKARAPGIKNRAELERWLLDQSEFGAALDEEFSRRYIAMTCKTDDPAQLIRNAETFRAVVEKLSRREGVVIFPEGISLGTRHLEEMRTGAAPFSEVSSTAPNTPRGTCPWGSRVSKG